MSYRGGKVGYYGVKPKVQVPRKEVDGEVKFDRALLYPLPVATAAVIFDQWWLFWLLAVYYAFFLVLTLGNLLHSRITMAREYREWVESDRSYWREVEWSFEQVFDREPPKPYRLTLWLTERLDNRKEG